MDPQTARTLWQLTQGNILYLRHIVEQAVADGHLVEQSGYWQWVGEPVVPHGLVELVETRMGALPDAVGAVVDALAIGEPIELATLRRIVDPDAVEEAEVRGLIRLDDLDERHRSAAGAPAVRRGAQEARGVDEAAAAAGAVGGRACGCRRRRTCGCWFGAGR